ncbi:hypothetical protein CEXT_615581 [Caerostris extrusa]|uniref:Uncharacterized protein n=1 Tax=Caerostris extrusa TaxID=172846 RepID=A0AAV4U8X2_CAEEX|nr:hypothetical protein CEXT_615581 [Caerostris extrusa]
MERWKVPQGITCKSCVRTVDEKPSLPSCCNMITPNGHGTPLKTHRTSLLAAMATHHQERPYQKPPY